MFNFLFFISISVQIDRAHYALRSLGALESQIAAATSA
jgi:hypothetical protein